MLEKEKRQFTKEKTKEHKGYSILNYHVLEGMADWVRVIDKKGTVIYTNKTMRESLGADLEGKKCYEPLGKYAPCSYCITQRSIETAEIVQKEEKVGDRYFSVKSSPIFNSDGNIYAAVEVFRDITREKKLERELKEKNKKMSNDLIFAKTLQEKILPQKGVYKNIELDFLYRPCDMLSGDMFDIYHIDDNHVGIYISDVAGHGVTASMMTMFVRQTMRAIKDDFMSPADTLTELHKRFVDLGLENENYFTMFYGVLDIETNEFKYSNAGHNCIPILFNDEKTELMKLRGFPISYLFNEIHYVEDVVQLQSGDKVLLYTDGITEMENLKKEQFGLEGVVRVIEESKGNILNDINREVKQFRWGDHEDDYAVVLMEVLE